MNTYFGQQFTLWKAKNKDPESFAQVYDLYVDKIYRFIYFKVSQPELAQDLTAETFLKGWEYLVSGNKVDNLSALLYRIARNLVIDHYRKKHTQEVIIDEELLEHESSLVATQLPKLQDVVGAKLELEQLIVLMQELKEEYREVLILKHIEEFSIGEIAQVTQKNAGAVRVTLHRAQKALQVLLDENR